MNPIFDADWHRQALDGESEAVETLAEEMLGPLYRFCLYRLGRDRHLCEDVVQETLLSAIDGLDRYDPGRSGGNIFPWLTGLARNEIRRALAGRKEGVSLEVLWTQMDKQLLEFYTRLDEQPFGEELLARDETRELVNAAMSQLPPRYGQALENKYVFGQSVREIAADQRISEKAVESLLSRAREAFRTAFLALAANLRPETAS